MPQEVRAGIDTHWRVWGNGTVPLLLLHCGLGSSRLWAPVGQALAGRCACSAPDFPGHGRSGPFRAVGDVHDQATDQAATFLRGDDVLVGHSFGATVALRLALERRGTVRALVLVEPVLFAAAQGTTAFDSHQAAQADWAQAFAAGDHTGAARGFHAIWGDGPWDDLTKEMRARMARRMAFVAASDAALTQDRGHLLASGTLESLAIPVILLHGNDSPSVIGAIIAALARRLPQAEKRAVPGAAHMLPVTHPEQVVTAVQSVL